MEGSLWDVGYFKSLGGYGRTISLDGVKMESETRETGYSAYIGG